ncbi:uncharacterized protein LOC115390000 isoform X2 [Salarias fasciatus]|uniref:uncharacterized protein LOC115390000 isoform X2 n=1 Tax=Salarias fasciatus TaxID=181472 RepID=UPI001176AE8A|nr:uncharacterized protein LOC115390000 isoform X2 [Salarias fasciatus]
MLAYWVIVLLCHRASSENLLYKESGESVTLRCFSEGCFQRTGPDVSVKLYHEFITRHEVLYWYSRSHESSPRKRNVQVEGVFISHNVTISGLTVSDSGVYTCVYSKGREYQSKCNEYTLVVRGRPPCAETQTVYRDCLIVSCFIVAVLAIVVFFLLIIPKVKKRLNRRRQTCPEFTVYEEMTRKSFQPAEAAEQSTPSKYELA